MYWQIYNQPKHWDLVFMGYLLSLHLQYNYSSAGFLCGCLAAVNVGLAVSVTPGHNVGNQWEYVRHSRLFLVDTQNSFDFLR